MLKVNNDILEVELPQGHTMADLTNMCKDELNKLIKEGVFYGKDIKINGRLTTSMALLMGHELAHVCKSVSIFDPKENEYIVCIKH